MKGKPGADGAGDGRLSRRRALAWLAVGAGALLMGYALFSKESPEEQIRRTVTVFAAALASDSGENPLVAKARVRGALEELTVPEMTITFPDFPSVRAGRDGLSDALATVRKLFRTAEVELSDLDIEVTGDGALVTAQGKLSGVDRHGRRRLHEREVQLTLVKDDGWRVKRVAVGTE
ncbi:MAG: DUF4440 domain-containing protein [Polyangiaceae bacterium]|nr:DUF4440 domain-containing protein [Polyangiaceae bacterium]MCW5791378.1 DUF4440 domain-containing protein [Polyangiaceae bacterium]